MSQQSYNKKRRSCDFYEFVILVWEILTVISGYIQVGRDLTPTSPTNVRTPHTWYWKTQ